MRLIAHSSRVLEFHVRRSVWNRLLTECLRAKPKGINLERTLLCLFLSVVSDFTEH